MKHNISKPFIVVTFISFFMFIFVGCSLNWHTDPFVYHSNDVQRARLRQREKVSELVRPISEESIRIEAQDYYVFREGEDSVFVIKGRSLIGSVQNLKIRIKDLDEFPGAEEKSVQLQSIEDINSSSLGRLCALEIHWKPEIGSVSGDSWIKQKDLTVELTADILMTSEPTLSSHENPVISRTSKLQRTLHIPIFVERMPRPAQIVAVEEISSTLISGKDKTRYWRVRVEDPDSKDQDGARPQLFILPPVESGKDSFALLNLEPYIQIDQQFADNPQMDINHPHIWNFYISMNLKDEITNRIPEEEGEPQDSVQPGLQGHFSLQTVSRRGVMSSLYPISVPLKSISNRGT